MNRSTIQLQDGWAFVARGNKKARPIRKPVANPRKKPADEAEADIIVETLNHGRRDIEMNTKAARVEVGLYDATEAKPLTHAFCLGLGSLSSGNQSHRKRSQAQLAGFNWLTGFPHMTFDQGRGVFHDIAIDPSFTQTDEMVMARLPVPITAVNEATPEHLAAIDGSLVYAPYLPWPVLLLDYLDGGDRKPMVLVCQNVRSIRENLELRHEHMGANETIEVDGRQCTEDDVKKGLEACEMILKEYATVGLAVYSSLPLAFEGMIIYVRRGDWEDGGRVGESP